MEPQISAIAVLSRREQEVFYHVVRGEKNKAIGKKLCISARTVETHRARIFRKLGIPNLADLVHFAIATSLITLKHPESMYPRGKDTNA